MSLTAIPLQTTNGKLIAFVMVNHETIHSSIKNESPIE